MTRPVAAVFLLFVLAMAAGVSASPHDEPPAAIETLYARIRAVGIWLQETIGDWFRPTAVSAKQGTHIIPDGSNGPSSSTEEGPNGEQPGEHRELR